MLAKSEPVPDKIKKKTIGNLVDHSLYNMHKGHLLRVPNIRRPDGRYKVQISVEEFFGSSTFDVEFNPFDCMADYGLFQNLHKEVTACECQ